METYTEEMYCPRCKETVDAYERNDGYGVPDYGVYNAYVWVCPKCGDTDLEEI